jgi:hypothetical protein
MMVQEKVRQESLSEHAVLRHEDPNLVALPNADAEEITSITGPFGNSTRQNKVSGLDRTDAISRPGDRIP